ncbi:MAG TPA: NINE protein [Hymenobacter sp.]|uniref:NINE protein n=1 Tax=Hymenobacter sp. TaxID=1898978 RepID=UPI002ED9EE6E
MKRVPGGAVASLQRGAATSSAGGQRAAPRQHSELPVPYRSKALAILLALVFGVLGAHLFYLREPGSASGILLMTLAGAALLLVGAAMASGALAGGFVLAILVNIVGASAIVTSLLIALFDVVRILTGHLKPFNGRFHPRFFQLRLKPEAPALDPTK